jgi:hypothetical protein
MTTFSASLTNLTALLPQSHDCSCYVSRQILAPPPLWLQKRTDLRAHHFAHSPDLWHICIDSLTLLESEAGNFMELILLYLLVVLGPLYDMTLTCFSIAWSHKLGTCLCVTPPRFAVVGMLTNWWNRPSPTRRRSDSIDMFKQPGTVKTRKTVWSCTRHALSERSEATCSSHIPNQKHYFAQRTKLFLPLPKL